MAKKKGGAKMVKAATSKGGKKPFKLFTKGTKGKPKKGGY